MPKKYPKIFDQTLQFVIVCIRKTLRGYALWT